MLAAAACAVADVAATGWMSCALLLLDGCTAAVAAHRRTGTGKSLNCSNKIHCGTMQAVNDEHQIGFNLMNMTTGGGTGTCML